MANSALATRRAVESASTEGEFVNPDGTPASWIRPFARSRRWIHFALFAVPGAGLGLLIIIGQAKNGTWIDGLAIGGLVLIISLGLAYARFVDAKVSMREYATQFEAIPDKERYQSPRL